MDTALVHFLGGLVALPALLVTGLPPAAAWPYIAASLVIHVGYYVALVGAYRHGELGLTYPIMRGAAPLLVALGSAAVLGEKPSGLAWLGILGVTAGVALVGLSRPGVALHHGKAVAFALANAAIIALYTFVDGIGVRITHDAGRWVASYVLLLFVLDGWPYPAIVWMTRDRPARRRILTYARRRWPVALLGGIASIGSYAIALWAMTRAPVASVAALRETSVLFAALLATFILGERFGPLRLLGTLLIGASVMALKLG